MGILQLARVLHVVIATHFWGYRSKSGISVSEITLGIAGMPNRIADNFNGVVSSSSQYLGQSFHSLLQFETPMKTITKTKGGVERVYNFQR